MGALTFLYSHARGVDQKLMEVRHEKSEEKAFNLAETPTEDFLRWKNELVVERWKVKRVPEELSREIRKLTVRMDNFLRNERPLRRNWKDASTDSRR